MAPLDQIGGWIKTATTAIGTIGFSVAILMVMIHAISIMVTGTKSATGQRSKWENLANTLICAGIVASASILVTFSTNLFGQLHAV